MDFIFTIGVCSLKDTWQLQVFVINETELESDEILCHITSTQYICMIKHIHTAAFFHVSLSISLTSFHILHRNRISVELFILYASIVSFAAVIAIEKHS